MTALKEVRGYRNGILGLTSTYAKAPTASTSLVSIGRGNSKAREFRGLIDEVRIHNRVLSQSEIQAPFNQQSGGKTPGWPIAVRVKPSVPPR
jgi:hypothetical protein